jgi:hypothetical protein
LIAGCTLRDVDFARSTLAKTLFYDSRMENVSFSGAGIGEIVIHGGYMKNVNLSSLEAGGPRLLFLERTVVDGLKLPERMRGIVEASLEAGQLVKEGDGVIFVSECPSVDRGAVAYDPDLTQLISKMRNEGPRELHPFWCKPLVRLEDSLVSSVMLGLILIGVMHATGALERSSAPLIVAVIAFFLFLIGHNLPSEEQHVQGKGDQIRWAKDE